MANKREEKRRSRVRNLIQDSKKIINDFDQKEIKPKHYVIAGLIHEVLYEIDFLKKWINHYELFSEEYKDVLNEQQKNSYLNIIRERQNNLEELRKCFAGLHRVYKHVGLNLDDH